MGLKNITESAIELKYNGMTVKVAPGQVIDVRDFNINNAEVMAVEQMLTEKHVDSVGKKQFENVKTLSNMTDAQINAEIKRLNEVIEAMKEEVAPREAQLTEAATQVADLTGKLELAAKRIEQLEADLEEAKAKIKNKNKDA